MKFIKNKSVIVSLCLTEIDEGRIYFDMKTFKELGLPKEGNIKFEGESDKFIRYDNFGNGCRTNRLDFIKSNVEKLYNNNKLEIQKISENPILLKLQLLNSGNDE
ncbi:hypothetical protein [Paenibacillus sp. FSL R10-2748]|uniref:hypothetical protein n=1 Tax=Paenibacillus sp. FSL R10-2748 TaxID=2954658 RepID=UPI0030FB49D7